MTMPTQSTEHSFTTSFAPTHIHAQHDLDSSPSFSGFSEDTIDRARAVLSPIFSPPEIQPQSTRSESYLNQQPHYFNSSSWKPHYPWYEKPFIPHAPTFVRSKTSTASRILPNLSLRRSNASQTPPPLRIIPDYQAYIRSLPPSHFRLSTYSLTHPLRIPPL